MNQTAKVVLEKLNKQGYQAYLVGGYPRDNYLGRNTDDLDICTNAPFEVINSLFQIKKTNYGASVIIIDGIEIELTQFRKESDYQNHRFPKTIEYVNDLKTDLLRRDFTINTLCIDKDGKEIDLLGAKKDMDNRIIRSVGDASTKLEEDALRILRAIRFATILNFEIDLELSKAIIKHKKLVSNLSYYRKRQELDYIIKSEYRLNGFSLLKRYELIDILNINNISDITKDMSLLEVWHTIDPNMNYDYRKEEKRILKELK